MKEKKPDWHSMGVKEVFKELGSDINGLTEEGAKKRLGEFGYNELVRKKRTTALEIFLGQFKNFLIIILLAAIFISIMIGEYIDAAVILLIVILNAVLGFLQEYRAEKSLEALQRMISPEMRIVRDGRIFKIPVKNLVPGDIIHIEEGDKIPADSRLIEISNLKVDESALTGESIPVEKNSHVIDLKTPLPERKNMVFTGTAVVYGRGIAIVTETGMSTEFGKIAGMLQTVKKEKTPLQARLDHLGKQIGILVLLISGIIFAVGILKQINPLSIFLTAVSLAVAAIPEGLPAVVTITLALGLNRMVKRNAIVRKLPAVETLGSTTVICSDKTGTLTRNEMTVRRIYVNDDVISVTGEGYKPDGEFYTDNKKFKNEEDMRFLLRISALCNNSYIDKKNDKLFIGDPTEISLMVAAAKADLWQDELSKKYPRIAEVPFDSKRKRMTTIHGGDSEVVAYMKGAPDIVIELCAGILRNGGEEILDNEERTKILGINDQFAGDALRVLAVAYRRNLTDAEEFNADDIEKDFIFVGLLGMIDPPREDAKKAVEIARNAGICSVMITGDQKLTAIAVGREMDLFRDGYKVIEGTQLDDMGDDELESIVNDVAIYARVSPEHKLRIVKALKKRGHMVAMTGDGVNDAPALKESDIGIAMGITGTDVTKEASDMILMDDNFSSIVAAIEEGRGIYDNIKKFVKFLLTSNLSEVLVIFLAIMIGFKDNVLPLIPVQILWVNLITDGLPALALGVDPNEPDVMRRRPRNPKEKIFGKSDILNLFFVSSIITVGVLLMFSSYLGTGDFIKAQTVAFTTLVMFEIFYALSCRSEKRTLLEVGILSNKYLILAAISSILLQLAVVEIPLLQAAFRTTPLSLLDWLGIIAISMTAFLIPESLKLGKR